MNFVKISLLLQLLPNSPSLHFLHPFLRQLTTFRSENFFSAVISIAFSISRRSLEIENLRNHVDKVVCSGVSRGGVGGGTGSSLGHKKRAASQNFPHKKATPWTPLRASKSSATINSLDNLFYRLLEVDSILFYST